MTGAPSETIKQTLDDPRLQLAIYTASGRLMDHRATAVSAGALPEYQDLRTQANLIKEHTIENLDYYLEQFEAPSEATLVRAWAGRATKRSDFGRRSRRGRVGG